MLPSLGKEHKDRFEKRKLHATISNIFSPSDEAFGLMMILNELHVWDMQYHFELDQMKKHGGTFLSKGKNKKRLPRGTKTFVDYRSGLQKGWSEEGLFVFNMIYKEVKKRREESKELEEMMRQRFIKESNGNQQQKHRNGRSKQYKNVEIEMSEDLKNMFEKECKDMMMAV